MSFLQKYRFILQQLLIILSLFLAIMYITDNREGYDTKASVYSKITTQNASPTAISLGAAEDKEDNTKLSPTMSKLTKYHSNNYNIQYHDSAEDIQKQLGLDVSSNLIPVYDKNGRVKMVPFSKATTNATYYTAGELKYNPTNYVPNYEDTIYFSKLTGLGYQSPVQNTDHNLTGFCSYNRFFPEKIEEKCLNLNPETCASTTCCALMGNSKCVAGDIRGPYYKAHYSDIDIKNRDKYFFMGRCYGNCVDDQSNMYDYNSKNIDNTIIQNTYKHTFPEFSENNPAYLPTISNYLKVAAPPVSSISMQTLPKKNG